MFLLSITANSYDITARSTFENLPRWVEESERYSTVEDYVTSLVGEKEQQN